MLGLFLSTAYGQAATATTASAGAKPTMLETIFPFVLIMVFFYFFVGRPQQKKAKDQQAFLANIKRGDQVITAGGILGEVTGIADKFVTLQIADNVRIKVVRAQIASTVSKEGNP